MTHIIRHNRELVSDRDKAVLVKARRYLNGVTPTYWFDFMDNESYFEGQFRGPVQSVPGFSFSRASQATGEGLDGSIMTFSSGEMRLTNKGLLVEPSRQNLFLNSSVGATQDVTVTAVAHTLSFRGTGTITLSGASTAGPLVGTGVGNTVSLTFTPSAGTLTLTVSGSVTNVQLEIGAGPSSWVPTAGASSIRAADNTFIPVSGLSYPVSLWAEFERRSDGGTGECIFQIDNNSTSDDVSLRVGATDLASIVMFSSGVAQASVQSASAVPLGTPARIAARFNTNSVHGAFNGALFTAEDVSATLPAAPTFIHIGYRVGATAAFFGYVRRLAVFSAALSDSDLQLVSAL